MGLVNVQRVDLRNRGAPSRRKPGIPIASRADDCTRSRCRSKQEDREGETLGSFLFSLLPACSSNNRASPSLLHLLAHLLPLLLFLPLVQLSLREHGRFVEEGEGRFLHQKTPASAQPAREPPEHGQTACSTTTGGSGCFRTRGRLPSELTGVCLRWASCVASGLTPQLWCKAAASSMATVISVVAHGQPLKCARKATRHGHS